VEDGIQISKLIIEKRLGNVKIDQRSKTMIFEENNDLVPIISSIECQNLELVDVLNQVSETRNDVKTSQEYAKSMVKKKGHGDSK
jgi:site-specific DNA-adenine methylase